MSSQEWKKEIAKCFNQDTGMSPEEAKIAFLKVKSEAVYSAFKNMTSYSTNDQ